MQPSTATNGRGPTVRRRQLGKELRRLREGAGKTIAEAAEWAGIKPPTISKIENGRQAIRPTNVRLLLQLYGIEAPDADTLIRLAGEASQRGWWASYGDTVPDWFRNFVGLESDASEIDGYDSELVPGQLQTSEYAEAVTLAAHPSITRDELKRLVTFRRERQQRLVGNTPPRLHFVLNEAVLRRPVGTLEAFGQQLDHLTEMAELPHVDLQVLPFSAGPHAAMGQTFRIMRFPGDEAGLDFVYLENDRGALYLERPADVERYQTIFTQLPRQPCPTMRAASSSIEYEVKRANESRYTMDLTSAVWRKSSRSNGSGGDCVEVADLDGFSRAVRDSKNPTGPALRFAPAQWAAFTSGIRDGQFD